MSSLRSVCLLLRSNHEVLMNAEKKQTRMNKVTKSPSGLEDIKSDLFGIYSTSAKRVNHVGLVKEVQGKYLVTIEGNSNNRVESRRRHLSTVYAFANWVNE